MLALAIVIILDHLLFTLFLIQQFVVDKFESRDNAWNMEWMRNLHLIDARLLVK